MTEQDEEDLALGRRVRLLKGDLVGTAHFACLLLIEQAVRLGAARSEYTEHRVTAQGKPVGDWKIIVEEGAGDAGRVCETCDQPVSAGATLCQGCLAW